MTAAKSVRVELAGIHLSVRTDLSKDTVSAITRDIEDKLRRIDAQARNVPLNRRLILVLLMLGEELHNERAKLEDIEGQLRRAREETGVSKKELADSAALVEQLREELTSSRRARDSDQTAHEALKEELASAHEQIARLNKELANAREEIEQLSEDADAATASGAEATSLRELRDTIRDRAQTALSLVDADESA